MLQCILHIYKMRNFCVFGLVVLCFVASALAENPELSKEQMSAVEKLLSEAELEEDHDAFDDGNQQALRVWNPFAWVRNLLRNKCKCENNKCDCCFKLRFIGDTACLTASQLTDEKAIQILFKYGDDEMVNTIIPTNRKYEICGPVPSLPILKMCLLQQSEQEADNSITSCTRVEVRFGKTVGAVLQFRCLEIKEGKISFGGFDEVEKSNAVVVKVKNPLKAVIAIFKNSNQ